MKFDTDNTHEGWEAQKGFKPHKQYGAMNPLKRMIDLLGVTMEELRSGCRERRLADARTLLAAALPLTQNKWPTCSTAPAKLWEKCGSDTQDCCRATHTTADSGKN